MAAPEEDIFQKGYDPAVARRLVGFMRPYAGRFLLSLVLMLLHSAAAVAGPYLVKTAIDEGMAKGSWPVLLRTALFYLLVISIQWASIFWRVNIMGRVGQSIIYDLRMRLFEHLQRLSLNYYSRSSVGRVITRVINDVGVIREFITWALLAVARDLFTVVGIILAMLSLNLRLSLVAFTVLPLMIFFTALFRSRARQNYRLVRSAISWVNSVLAENINGVREVQAFSRQPVNYAYFRDEVNRNNLDTNLRAARLGAAFPAVIDLLGAVSIGLVVYVGGLIILRGDAVGVITPGVLTAFVLYIERFFEPIRDLSSRYDSFQASMAGGERIFALLDAPVELQDEVGAREAPPIQGEVCFEGVYYQYEDEPDWVLRDINLTIKAGETVALVGRTGAGKSTLVKLVSRFHDPTQGRVTIDGIDLRTVTQNSLRRQMGIVLQDPFLFSGSVAENIRFGRLDAADEEIVAAARAVGAHDFIEKLPRQYDTAVEEGGVILSVGQRQLISFARALLANPRILILDEATSSIDTEAEQLIQLALKRLLKGRTAIVIAHRLSTIVNADRIIVIEDGRIVEQGKHADLMAAEGVYQKLYRAGFEG